MCFGLLSFALAIIIYKAVPSVQISTQAIAIFELIKSTLSHPPAWILALVFGVYAGQRFSSVGFLLNHLSAISISLQTAGVLTAMVCNGERGGYICMWVVITAWAESASVDANGFCGDRNATAH